MVTLICSVFLLITLILSIPLYNKRIINPALVFLAVWFIVFFLYEIDQIFFGFFKPISSYAEILFSAGFMFFFLGSLSAAINKDIPRKIPPNITNNHLRFIYRTTKILILIFLTSFSWKGIILFQRYSNPFANLYQIRYDYVRGLLEFPFHLDFIVTFTGYLIVLNLGILIVLRKSRKIKILTLLAILVVFFSDASVAGRGWSINIFFFLISTILVTYNVVLEKEIKLKQCLGIITSGILLALLMTTIFSLRAKTPVNFGRSLTVDTFQYAVGNISSTGYFMENPLPTGPFGYNTFGGLLKLANDVSKAVFEKSFLTSKDPQRYYADISDLGPFNTSSHFALYYADFGAIGIIIISYLLGFISSYLFLKAVFYKRIIDIQLSAITFAMILFSVRGIYSNARFFWVLILSVVLQYYLSSRPSKRAVRVSHSMVIENE